MKGKLSIGVALCAALFSSSALADMSGDNMDVAVRVYGGTVGYSNQESSTAKADQLSYVKYSGNVSDNLVWGGGLKFDYMMDNVGFCADVSYKVQWGLSIDVNDTSATNHTLTDAKLGSMKGKAVGFYAFNMGTNSMFTAGLGLGLWNMAYTHAAVAGKTVALDLTTNLFTLPVGVSFKGGMSDDVSFSASLYGHYLITPTTTTLRNYTADKRGGGTGLGTSALPGLLPVDGKTAIEITHPSDLTSDNKSYALSFEGSIGWNLSDGDSGLGMVSIGGYYDYYTLGKPTDVKTGKHTFAIGEVSSAGGSDVPTAATTVSDIVYNYAAATDSQYGMFLSIGF